MKRIILAVILLIALTVRIAYLTDIWNTPLARVPIIDSEYYHTWALALVKGSGAGGVFFMSPLYPYVISVLYRFFGCDPRVILVFQMFGGVFLVYLIYRLGVRLFSPTIGLISALIAALYQPFIYYDGALLSAVLILILNAGALLLLLAEKPRKYHFFAAGALLGLSALARPNILIFVGLIVVYYLLSAKRSDLRVYSVARSVALLLGVALVLLPVMFRNHLHSGEWVLTTAGYGMNFYAGNNPAAEGIYWEAPFLRSAEPQYENEDYRLEASRRTGQPLSVNQASRYWLNQGIAYIVSQPLSYMHLLLTKLFLFFHNTEIPNNVSIYAALDFSKVLRTVPFTFGLIAPFGFAFWIRRLKHSNFAIVHLYGSAFLLTTLLFFAASEYRLPILLVLIPCASMGFLDLWKNVKNARWRPFVTQLILTLLFAVPINMSTPFTDSIASPRMDFFNLGSVLQKQNRNIEAAAMFQKALFLDPKFTAAHIALGDAYHALGQHDQAAEEFRRGGLDPERELRILDAEKLFADADAKALLGDFESAWKNYSAGIAQHPDPPVYAYYNLAYLSLQKGDTLQALDEIKTARDHYPDEPKIIYLNGWIEEKRGELNPALEHFLRALELNPTFHEARAHAASVCIRLGDRQRAAKLIEPLLGVHLQSPELQKLVDRVAAEAGY